MTESDAKEIKEELAEVKKLMLEIKNHFGIGSNVVRLVDIREQARKAVERAKHGRKNPA